MSDVTVELLAKRQRVPPGAVTLASRRDVMGLALGAVTAAALGTPTLAAADPVKKPQKSVDYQGHAKGGKSCNTCKAFQPPSKCKTVEGYVEPAGWCNLYEKK